MKCLVHRLRTQTRHDDRVTELLEDGDLEGLRSYLEVEYEAQYTELVEELKEGYRYSGLPRSSSSLDRSAQTQSRAGSGG